MNKEAAKIFSRIIMADKPVRIKLLGDSITHGHSGTGFRTDGEQIIPGVNRNPNGYCWANLLRDYLQSRYNCQVVNNGICGVYTQFLIDHFDELVDDEDDIVLCMIGTNDRHQWAAAGPKKTKQQRMQEVYTDILNLEEKLRKAGKPTVFMVSVPAEGVYEAEESATADAGQYWRQLHMDDIHDLYVKASIERDFPLIDHYTYFREYCRDNGVALSELLKDGCHPNDRGYELMFRLILDELGFALPTK